MNVDHFLFDASDSDSDKCLVVSLGMMYGNKMAILALALQLFTRKAPNNQAQDKCRLEKK